MKVKTYKNIVNDETSIIHYLKVPVEEVELEAIDRDYSNVSLKSRKKFFKIIDKTIDYDKEIFSDTFVCSVYPYEEYVTFEVRTRDKKLVEREEKVKKALKEHGFDCSGYAIIDAEEDEDGEAWIRTEGIIHPNKKNMDKINKIPIIDDWSVEFDGHMETEYVYLKLKESIIWNNTTMYLRTK